MNFNEFVNEVKGNIKLFLPKDYENAEVSTMECHKLNRAYTGLMVRKEGELLTPTINLNQLYEAYKTQPSVTMETVCRKIADIVLEAPIQVDLKAILNYEDVKDKLFIRVSSAEANKEVLENAPHQLKEDLAITYHVVVGKDQDGLATVIICFVLGYVLLVSLDKISNPSLEELFISIYTVFTQFGMLIFSVLTIQTFATDYKAKNILFYKLMGYNWLRFFLEKVGVLLFWMSVMTLSGICLISILYQDFSLTIVTMFYFESALIYEILLASMWGFLLKSVIGSYVSNFAFWIIAMIASIANHKLSFLARYDASNPIFLRFNQYYNTGNTEYLDIIGNVIYTIILSGVILGIVCAFRKRWEKNGI